MHPHVTDHREKGPQIIRGGTHGVKPDLSDPETLSTERGGFQGGNFTRCLPSIYLEQAMPYLLGCKRRDVLPWSFRKITILVFSLIKNEK